MVYIDVAAMRLATLLSIMLLPCQASASTTPPGRNAILLSNVHTLTLRADGMTTARRVSPIPQLKCVGPARVCRLYKPEIMRCTNDGYGYDEEDVQWTCKAPLPPEFKLGSTDVICEGYRNADDKWVLKGSCGVEYRLFLTEEGEKRFGNSNWDSWKSGDSSEDSLGTFGTIIFWFIMIAVALLICIPCIRGLSDGSDHEGRRPRRRGGYWGGGGGGGGGYPPGPPPPYSRYADGFDSYKRYRHEEGWRPGFWSGALGGAAAGYGLGRSRNSGYSGRNYDPGEGSSGSRTPGFSSTSTSTGFGSTRRR